MAAHGAGYEEENAAILEFVARLTKAKLFENGFYAGMQLKTPADFDDHCEAWGINLPMLKGCEAFVLIYPTPIPTSALIELGIALTRDIPVRVFTKDIEKLPFLLRQPTRALADLIVVKYRDLGQVVDFLSKDAEVLEALGIVSPLNSSRS